MAEAPIEAEVNDDYPLPEGLVPPEMAPGSVTMQTAPPQTGSGPVIVHDRYFIDPNTPLPLLDSPSAKAYSVEDRRDLSSKMFALICTPGLPTRTDVMAVIRGEELDGLIPMVEWEIVDWPLLNQWTMAVLYERPKGGRVMDAIEAGSHKLNEYEFPRRIMAPLVSAVKSMSGHDQTHRAIRPSNVFFMDDAMQTVVLGDCTTSPPGFDQPMMFEPIDRSMAAPGGRGTGGLADDVYALGATLVVLMLGYNPVGKISDEDLLALKMEQGSYAAICGNARLPIPLLEPLRGMLNDTVATRWGLEELTGWLAGQKQPSLKQTPVVRSDFPFLFEGHSFYSPRTLSRYLSRHRETAMKAITNAALIGWLRKGVQDAARADGIIATIETAALHKDEPQGTDEYIVAKACMALDPQAPIRYKGFTFMPDGFAAALAVEYLHRGDAKIPLEILKIDLPSVWYSLQRSVFAGASLQQSEYARLRGFLGLNEPGFGFERCLYESNPTMPCQSELIIKDYVYQIEDVLKALDDASSRVDTKIKPMDRHLAAFIAASFDEDIHPHLKALAAPVEETTTIGMLSLLAFLQWKLRIGPLYGLSSWVGGLLGPAINTYHSRTTRREIEKEIPRLVRKGSLPELFDLIDNADNRRSDAQGFEAAAAEYATAEYEIREIEGAGSERQSKAEKTGKQTAAVISVVLSMITASILLIVKMF
ncbi:MAG: protein kinase family protein [Rhodospirillales bacterium]|nr:protein kinase family protein [Rhodospirillales bacterium]